jgi:hypothetical protein
MPAKGYSDGKWRVICSELAPIVPVESPILDSFSNMGDGDRRLGVKISDGSGNFEDAVVGASGQALLHHCAFEEAFGFGGELAEGAHLAGAHLRVGKDFFGGLLKSDPLAFARSQNPVTDLGRTLSGGSGA